MAMTLDNVLLQHFLCAVLLLHNDDGGHKSMHLQTHRTYHQDLWHPLLLFRYAVLCNLVQQLSHDAAS